MLLANSSRPRALQSSTPITKMANLTTAVVVETKFNKDFVGLCQEDIIGSVYFTKALDYTKPHYVQTAAMGLEKRQERGISGGSDQGLMNWAKALITIVMVISTNLDNQGYYQVFQLLRDLKPSHREIKLYENSQTMRGDDDVG
ncbi:hypothetical protein BY996DRAFT_6415442 [Phakopsora pachyrhizi]|nr:hypothetical protein BY996DRAFT_6415442 [Phakopsora pachyrhizi]